jgi:hypothetical protein
MKIVMAGNKPTSVQFSFEDWKRIGATAGWLTAEAKKKKYKHSPKGEGFIDECISKNKSKDDPGAYCASIVDKVKGTTDWRKGPRKKD